MKPSISLVERFLARVRNNRFAATLIIIGIIVSSLASFTDSLTRLAAMLPEVRKTKVAGVWQSDVLTDANTQLKYRYLFTLKADDARVHGSAMRTAPSCEGSNAGMCIGFGKATAIIDGRLERNKLSFTCDWGEIPGKTPWTYVRVKQTFRGVVNDATIRLLVQDEGNSLPFEFGAAQAVKGAVEALSQR